MMTETTIFSCDHIGVAGTTKVFINKTESGYEARVGVGIMGMTNIPLDELADMNPFNDDFHDNFARGVGTTEEEALAALKQDMHSLCESVWAF